MYRKFRQIPLCLSLIIICILIVTGCTTKPVLDNQPIAESYNVTPVTTPFITIDPISNHTIGDVFFINGTTNLPVSETLEVQIIPKKWARAGGWNPSAFFNGISIASTLSGTNRWSVNVTDIVNAQLDNRRSPYVAAVYSSKNPSNFTYQVFSLLPANNGTTSTIPQTPTLDPFSIPPPPAQ